MFSSLCHISSERANHRVEMNVSMAGSCTVLKLLPWAFIKEVKPVRDRETVCDEDKYEIEDIFGSNMVL